MPRGGKRAGAGQPPKSAEQLGQLIAFKLSKQLVDRLKARGKDWQSASQVAKELIIELLNKQESEEKKDIDKS